MARELMPKAGILMPYVVIARDAQVVGVSTVDNKAGNINLETDLGYIKAVDVYKRTDTYSKTQVDNLIAPIMSGALFQSDPFLLNDIPLRSQGGNGVTSVDLIKVTPDNQIQIGDTDAGVQGLHFFSQGRMDIFYNDGGIDKVTPLFSGRHPQPVADTPFATVGDYTIVNGFNQGPMITGSNANITQMTGLSTVTSPVGFQQNITVPTGTSASHAVNLQQVNTALDGKFDKTGGVLSGAVVATNSVVAAKTVAGSAPVNETGGLLEARLADTNGIAAGFFITPVVTAAEPDILLRTSSSTYPVIDNFRFKGGQGGDVITSTNRLMADAYGRPISSGSADSGVVAGSVNVASITRESPGVYNVLFTNPMANNTYTVVAGSVDSNGTISFVDVFRIGTTGFSVVTAQPQLSQDPTTKDVSFAVIAADHTFSFVVYGGK